MSLSTYPHLSPKPLGEFAPEEFHAYISSLHEIPVRSVPVEFSAHLNAKGTLVLTTKRKPKWCLRSELDRVSEETKKPINEVWNHAIKKGYAIRTTREQGLAYVGAAASS